MSGTDIAYGAAPRRDQVHCAALLVHSVLRRRVIVFDFGGQEHGRRGETRVFPLSGAYRATRCPVLT
eukprot:3747154-Rhodomonas_salina.1